MLVRIRRRREAPGGVVVVNGFGVIADVEGAEGGAGDAAGLEIGEGTGAFVGREEEGAAGGELAGVGPPFGVRAARGERQTRTSAVRGALCPYDYRRPHLARGGRGLRGR